MLLGPCGMLILARFNNENNSQLQLQHRDYFKSEVAHAIQTKQRIAPLVNMKVWWWGSCCLPFWGRCCSPRHRVLLCTTCCTATVSPAGIAMWEFWDANFQPHISRISTPVEPPQSVTHVRIVPYERSCTPMLLVGTKFSTKFSTCWYRVRAFGVLLWPWETLLEKYFILSLDLVSGIKRPALWFIQILQAFPTFNFHEIIESYD